MKYRKKPIVIEAFHWTKETNQYDFPEWLVYAIKNGDASFGGGEFAIETLEGLITGVVNDWIIKGVAGELYPCKPDIFEKTYEPVE